VLIQLDGYALRTDRPSALPVGARRRHDRDRLIDWPSFFFTSTSRWSKASLCSMTVDNAAARGDGGVALSILAFDLCTLVGGRQLARGLRRVTSVDDSPGSARSQYRFVLGQLDTFRRYFTKSASSRH
jgi:hypothetical protein